MNGTPAATRTGGDGLAALAECQAQVVAFRQTIVELETINLDLERRLEAQAVEQFDSEKEAEAREENFRDERRAYEAEGGEWRNRNELLQLQVKKLRQDLLWTQRELHGLLQKKYQGANPASNASSMGSAAPASPPIDDTRRHPGGPPASAPQYRSGSGRSLGSADGAGGADRAAPASAVQPRRIGTPVAMDNARNPGLVKGRRVLDSLGDLFGMGQAT